MFNKDNLRQKAKNIRKDLDMKIISEQIILNIRESDIYQKSEHVMLYYPLKTEVNLLELLNDNKSFYLPRVNGDMLECCPFKKGEKLVCSDFKVYEPISPQVDKDIIDLIFVPALCVDGECNRLGYGKGYYDRFLSKYSGISIIPIAEELVFSQICLEDHDISCSMIITQNKKKPLFDRG